MKQYPTPDNQDSKAVNRENGVWMEYDDKDGKLVHLAVDYEDIKHNQELGIGLVAPSLVNYFKENIN